jgi:urea-proton symporter
MIIRSLFYVSYFSTLMILSVIIIMFLRVFYIGQTSQTDIGSLETIFRRFSCLENKKNFDSSYKTFISLEGLMFGIINIIGNFGTVFVDQVG